MSSLGISEYDNHGQRLADLEETYVDIHSRVSMNALSPPGGGLIVHYLEL